MFKNIFNFYDFKRAIVAGMLIGIGVILNINIDNQYIRSMLFSFALLSIITLNLPLYTGKIGFYQEFKTKLIIMIIGNFLGVSIVVMMNTILNPGFHEQLKQISITKFNKEYIRMFLDGFFCGILMFVAVKTKKEIITVFCIMSFILLGFEHCIADFPYIICNFNIQNVCKFMFIVLGNSIGSITISLLGKEELLE